MTRGMDTTPRVWTFRDSDEDWNLVTQLFPEEME